MFIDYIKPIPKNILKRIQQQDNNRYNANNRTRYYAYLTIIKHELCKITVAVKDIEGKKYCKQMAAHYLPSKICYVKDTTYGYISGYHTGFYYNVIKDNPDYKFKKDYEDDKWYPFEDKYFDPYAPIVNLEVIDKLEKYKYSAYKLYNDVDIISYLRTYEKYPECEYLLKLGLQRYVQNTSILKVIQKDGNFIKWLVKSAKTNNLQKADVPIILKAYKTKSGIDKLQAIANVQKELRRYNWNNLPIENIWQNKLDLLTDYLVEQNTSLFNYIDYVKACIELNLDMTLNKNKKPNDFKYWHDVRIEQYATLKAQRDKEKRQKLYENFKKIAEKYITLNYDKAEDYICIIAQSPAELVKEGETLHHCVGRMGYEQKFINEKSLIFFVREKYNPQTPYVTIEYSIKDKKVVQCYGENNSKPNEKVINFVNNQWLEYTKKQLKQIAA